MVGIAYQIPLQFSGVFGLPSKSIEIEIVNCETFWEELTDHLIQMVSCSIDKVQ